MTIAEIFADLNAREAVLFLDDDGTLRYMGPALASDDPLRASISEWKPDLIELLTFAPGRRCVFTGCYRLVAQDSKVACLEHQREIDALTPPCERCGQLPSSAPRCEGTPA